MLPIKKQALMSIPEPVACDILDVVNTVTDLEPYCVEQLISAGSVNSEVLSKKITPSNATELSVTFGFDNKNFRDMLRSAMCDLSSVVTCYDGIKGLYGQLYKILDKDIYVLTQKVIKDFQQDIFENRFEPARKNWRPPYDKWRRINVCACSPFWRALTINAFEKLCHQGVIDQANLIQLNYGLKHRREIVRRDNHELQ